MIQRLLLTVLLALAAWPCSAQERLRVLVETDIGGDADDQASFVRFLLYTNGWDVEGIIADRSQQAFDRDPVRDHLGLAVKNGHELALAYLDAYAKVYDNLRRHDPKFPTPGHLRRRTVPGWNGTDEGVKLIIAAADRDDPRPIWYGNWGPNSGATSNLRRAFDLVKKTRSPEEYAQFVGKFRIVTLDGPGPTRQGHDEHVALHVETGYPTLDGGRWYHRFRPLTEKAGGFDVRRDVQKGHGDLGALYTTPKEGDSWTFIFLILTGLAHPTHPEWGGWAGRYGRRDGDPLNKNGPPPAGRPADRSAKRWGNQFYWANQRDTWHGTTSRDNTAKRWAVHLQNDFKARLDWCVAEKFAAANHAPVPHCQGDDTLKILEVNAAAGRPYRLTAKGTTDPDGDRLTYTWYTYPEPGTYTGEVRIDNADSADATLHVPADAAGKTIHVILEVTDDGEPALTRYRRVIVTP